MKNPEVFSKEMGLQLMTAEEMRCIDGGSFWEDVGYVLGVTARSFVEFCKTAGEFQASLPPNLKK